MVRAASVSEVPTRRAPSVADAAVAPGDSDSGRRPPGSALPGEPGTPEPPLGPAPSESGKKQACEEGYDVTGRHGFQSVGGWMGHFRLPLAFVLVNGLLLAPGWTIVGELRPPWLTGEAALLVPLLFFLPRTRWSRRLAFGLAVLPDPFGRSFGGGCGRAAEPLASP